MSETQTLQKHLEKLLPNFRTLKGWDIQIEDDPNNRCVSWGGRKSNCFRIGLWDESRGPEPRDYMLHEILHGVLISLVRIDKRRVKEQRQVEEVIVQDLCHFIFEQIGLSEIPAEVPRG